MSHGKFITIEGIEGAGKTTALTFIQALLEQANLPVLLTREPGGTDIAEEIRRVLLHRINNEVMQPETELLLMFASRAQHIHSKIEPALQSGTWVISDRYVDASYAYQGGGRGIDLSFITALDKNIVGKVYPDLTFLLDLQPELGNTRTEQRDRGKDRIEQEKIDFFSRVRQAYLERARLDPQRIKIIDASKTIEYVQMQISEILSEFLKRVAA